MTFASLQAQEQQSGQRTLDEIVVTAQKRNESMQDVPISIEVLSKQTLRELNMQDFFDYAKMVRSILSTPNRDEGTSWAGISMRGVNSGSSGHASTNTPTVGMYVDEMPVTTQCSFSTCGVQIYIVRERPTTIALKAQMTSIESRHADEN